MNQEKKGLRAAEEQLIWKALRWAELNLTTRHGYIHEEFRRVAEALQKAAEEYKREKEREESGEIPSQAERIAERIKALGYDPAKTPWDVARHVCEAEMPGWTVMAPNDRSATYDFSVRTLPVIEEELKPIHETPLGKAVAESEKNVRRQNCIDGKHEPDEKWGYLNFYFQPQVGAREDDNGWRVRRCKHCKCLYVEET